MAASKRLTMTALTLLKTSMSRASSPLLAYSRAKQLPLVHNVVPFDFSAASLSRQFHSSSSARRYPGTYHVTSADKSWSGFRDMMWEARHDLGSGVVETEDFMKILVEKKNGLAGRILSKAGLDNTSILQAIHDFISQKQPKVSRDTSYHKVGEHLNSLVGNAIKLKKDMRDDSLSVEHYILAFRLDRRFGQRLFANFGVSEKDLRDAIDAVRESEKRELDEHLRIKKELVNRIRSLKEQIDRVNVEIEVGKRAETRTSLRRQLEEAAKHFAEIVSKWARTHVEVNKSWIFPHSSSPYVYASSFDIHETVFSLMVWEAIDEVVEMALENEQEVVETEHLMKALLEHKDELARRIFRKAGLHYTSILQATDDFISKQPKVFCDGRLNSLKGKYMRLLFDNALEYKKDMKDDYLSAEHLLLAFYVDGRFGEQLFRNLGLSEKDLRDAIDAARASPTKLNDQWGIEKELMNHIRSLKEEIDRINVEKEPETLISLQRELQEAEKHLAEMESKWTGTHFEDFLNEGVVGQNTAAMSVASTIRRLRAGLPDRNRPIASFMFIGYGIVGETRLAGTLARYLFNSGEDLVQISMRGREERDSVSHFFGDPFFPDYDRQLTEIVRRRPYCVIVFYGIERAHEDALNILLQILENGKVTDYKGRSVSFKNTVIVVAADVNKHVFKYTVSHDSEDYDVVKKHVLDSAPQKFRPELVNLIDDCIVFHPLTPKEIEEIKMSRFKERLRQKNIELHYTDEVVDLLSMAGWIPAKVNIERFMECAIARRKFKTEKVCVLNVELDPKLDFATTWGKPTRKRTHFVFKIGTGFHNAKVPVKEKKAKPNRNVWWDKRKKYSFY